MDRRNQELDGYIRTLDRKLGLMPKRKKRSILMEVESHLTDAAQDLGGLNDKGYKRAIQRFGPPSTIAARMRHDYGPGTVFSVVSIVVVVLLSLFTVPLASDLQGQFRPLGNLLGLVSVLFTVMVFAAVIYAGFKGGRWHGLMAGITAWGTRTIVFFVMLLLSYIVSRDTFIEVSSGPLDLAAVTLVSLLMMAAGFLAGRQLKRLVRREL